MKNMENLIFKLNYVAISDIIKFISLIKKQYKMFKNLIAFIINIFFYQNLFSKPLEISGLKKLNLNDIQTITKIDIYKNDFQLYEMRP